MHGDSRSAARLITYTDPRFSSHAPLGFHPERPERLDAAERGLERVRPDFIERAAPIVESVVPGARVVCFGHMGDGNLHYNVSQPVGADKQAFLDRWEELNEAVHALVLEMNGSISAEHGIGQLKRRELARTAPPEALELMRRIKHAFDPAGIMNPGKVI